MLKEQILYAKRLVKEGKVNKILDSENFGETYEVKEYKVRIFTKKGRTLWECNCQSGLKFLNENPICVHKASVLLFNELELRLGKINDLKTLGEKYKKFGIEIPPDVLLSEIEGLRD